jgi:hypothetical protein
VSVSQGWFQHRHGNSHLWLQKRCEVSVSDLGRPAVLADTYRGFPQSLCFLLLQAGGMVLFGVSERPLTALDSSAPRLLRMAPLRHSLRAAPCLDAPDSDDTASTLSAPGYGEADGGSGEFVH